MNHTERHVSRIKIREEYPKCFEEIIHKRWFIKEENYLMLDEWFFTQGFSVGTIAVENKKGITVGWRYYIKAYANNVLKITEDFIRDGDAVHPSVGIAYRIAMESLLYKLEDYLTFK